MPGASNSDDEDDEEEEEEEDSEPITTVLCSLTPGKIEQATIDLILEEDQEIQFEAVGKNTVYLTGNFVDQTPAHAHGDEDDFSDLSDEDSYDLEDVSSDVEINPEDLEDDSARFEEINTEEPPKDSKKRPRDSDVTDADEPKLSKAEKKKLSKKLKAVNGEAIPTGQENVEPKAVEKKEKSKKEKESAEKPKPKAETKEVTGGVKLTDHKVGSGPQAKKGDTVSMRYVGKLQNGKVFDSNLKGQPFKFRLGAGEVIKGWDVGVAGMQAGGERLLTIPAPMAYGKKGQAGIPANSTLIFEVKLVKIN
ncbi:hypothetical protein PHLCEN_2v4738 [Hermanssonia centrifuga]|uniref:peptidylprolyl isomerase n=1 Tax=Hermanssonia centrifuga TaxID=98765 RepID=A0A2R6PJ90_9APHY|nr:hypothetical protein PHLCEN_2v4738 [Hermanssonia centrifuga]